MKLDDNACARFNGAVAGLAFRAVVDREVLRGEIDEAAYRIAPLAPLGTLYDIAREIVVQGRILERECRDPDGWSATRSHVDKIRRWRRENPPTEAQLRSVRDAELVKRYGPLDERPGDYRVSARMDDGSYLVAKKSYATHLDAMRAVQETAAEAEKQNPRAVWYAWGTCRKGEGTIEIAHLEAP